MREVTGEVPANLLQIDFLPGGGDERGVKVSLIDAARLTIPNTTPSRRCRPLIYEHNIITLRNREFRLTRIRTECEGAYDVVLGTFVVRFSGEFVNAIAAGGG